MTKLTVLPPFTGTTYDELLADVEQRILEDPTRLDMRWWVLLKDGKRPEFTPRGMHAISKPACGTVACLGGWIDERFGETIHGELTREIIRVGHISDEAWEDLFNPDVQRLDGGLARPSDDDYVQLVLDRLADFRFKHAESLKTPLPPKSSEAATVTS